MKLLKKAVEFDHNTFSQNAILTNSLPLETFIDNQAFYCKNDLSIIIGNTILDYLDKDFDINDQMIVKKTITE